MTTGELAHKLAISRVHAWRLACAGVVPATKKTKGGHFYFVHCPKLTRWINYTAIIGSKHRKKVMARAYKGNYGSPKFEKKKYDRHFMSVAKRAFNRANSVNLGMMGWDEFFDKFNYDTSELINILQFLNKWREPDVKLKMVKMSRERLKILRDLIDKWLSQKPATKW